MKNHLNQSFLSGKPEENLLSLPEKVLQFGTGVLLRALPDYLIHRANLQGVFNGSIVVVKSTGQGDAGAFARQHNLYTVAVRGIENGQAVAENHLVASISRVLNAQNDWLQVLEVARSPDLQLIVSNTTEIGLKLTLEDIRSQPPASFPGKLLAVLLARFEAFAGAPDQGLLVVPTELLPENGALLKSILLELSAFNRLPVEFNNWLQQSCIFCNSLVDRIVPGKPGEEELAACYSELGYVDELLTVAEPYHLWAIEGGIQVAEKLSFAAVSPENAIIDPDIDRFRERKLRLLNGVHTLSCGLAYLAGFHTVYDAMQYPNMALYMEKLMFEEILPSIPYPLAERDARDFGRQVLDRFRNPFVKHLWLNITVQYTSKMRMRNLPVLIEYYRKRHAPPPLFAFGFAAYLCFLLTAPVEIQDDLFASRSAGWRHAPPGQSVQEVLQCEHFWGMDLNTLPGFTASVMEQLKSILTLGARNALDLIIEKQAARRRIMP